MRNAFSIYPRDLTPGDLTTLRDDVHRRTGSAAETDSILRSIGRYGLDTSVRYFDVTPVENRLGLATTRAPAWAVRAVRI